MFFQKYLTWQGFLDNYNKDENVNNQLYYELYDYGKLKLFGVLLNKLVLFFVLLTVLLFISQILFLSRSYVGSLVLFLLFDILIDETFICTPLCELLDKCVGEIPSLKFNVSFSIQLNDGLIDFGEEVVVKDDKEEDKKEEVGKEADKESDKEFVEEVVVEEVNEQVVEKDDKKVDNE